ncbi:RDD family protein [Rubellicoccus peritrichatus]|uniref:RDD family protein n=1 Tax=Rubellicoccus peritrichatus TaxID=3080537 RepID=A0AAQ3LCZ9_9BACT|nr:RDD family protein [Puniceicoccus sp. CR14]WOO42174.1 RDD family protein [Puniceicoccus sp. CR14]
MIGQRQNQLIIQTQEGVRFSLPLASPVTRLVALVLDLATITAIMSVLGIAFTLMSLVSADVAAAFYALTYFVMSIGYFIFMEWKWRGQTLGKRVMKLRVMDEQGLRLRGNQLIIRNLLRFVDSLPVFYFVGGVVCLLTRRSQRLGDLAGGTVVIRHVDVRAPALQQILGDKYNSFRDHPNAEATLRQSIDPGEAEIALQALRRRNEFDPLERTRLFREIADYLKTRVKMPPSAVFGLTDEQFVRNCVDTLYRAAK